MKIFKILFLPVLFCFLLTACRTNRQVVKTNETKINEVTAEKTTYRDTVFYTQKTEASIKLPTSEVRKCVETPFNKSLNDVSKPKIWTQKNGNAKATIKILHDTLTLTAECDSIALEAKIKKEYFSRYLENVKTNVEFVEQTTKLNWQLLITLIIIAFIAGFVTKSLIKISI